MTAIEKEPGTMTCTGTFLDDPALWGHGKHRNDAIVFTVAADGFTVPPPAWLLFFYGSHAGHSIRA